MSIVSCKEDDCQRKVQARGMCSTHYSYWQRSTNKYELTCGHCGASFTHHRTGKATCSSICQQAYTLASEGWQQRAIILPPKRPATKAYTKKTDEEKAATRLAQRSALRAAYEDGRWGSLLDAILAAATLTEQGCWEWSRKIKGGYPVVCIAGRWHQVHRLSLLAKHGKPLGVLAAHHKCANSRCVNPEHLQPVTHRENAAEMLARNSLESRIKELEDALRGVSPGHEALNRIESAA